MLTLLTCCCPTLSVDHFPTLTASLMRHGETRKQRPRIASGCRRVQKEVRAERIRPFLAKDLNLARPPT